MLTQSPWIRPHFSSRRLCHALLWSVLALCQPLKAHADDAGHAEAGALANPAAVSELPAIDVISTTPLPGVGVSLDHVPANVQTLGAHALEGHGFDNLSEVMNGALGSVNVNDTQGNPYQIDVNVRGFTASPVLGTPQGLSVFVDGVRVNESFGDVVNWDLMPQNAIANVTLMPGANPQFGLNTLGAALSVVTKSGFQFPGTQLSLDGGSARRRQFQLETGGHGDALDYFVAANLYRDAGWADRNPSEVRQLFAKTGYQDDDTDVDLSLTAADNILQGNQTLPQSFLDNLHQVYTTPDITHNKLALLNLKGSQFFGKDLVLGGNAYYRHVSSGIFNSNANGNYNGINDSSGNPCAGQTPFLPDCPNAQNILNQITQNTFGLAVQLSDNAALQGHDNAAALGLSLDRGRTDFSQAQQDALVAADRSTWSIAPVVQQVLVRGGTDYSGLYATDTFSPTATTAVTVSGRYNRARVSTRFVSYDPATYAVAPDSGDFTYSRFNPAIGFNFNPSRGFNAYASYTEGMRTPTPVELSCASPLAPCALPNAFASDPYLKKVVSRTFEVGVRGSVDKRLHWSAALFRTRLQDDILFIADPNTPTQGYFTNVGDTQRQGIELGVDHQDSHWELAAHYTLLDARFETPFSEFSSSSAADASGLLMVPAGSTLPGVARQLLKLQARWSAGSQWSLGGSMLAQTSSYARGDESNRDLNGAIAGFAVCNLDARMTLQPQLELGLHVNNLFNRVYSTYGQLATNFFNQPGHTFDSNGQGQSEQFRSIGAPRLGYLTLTWWFDRPAQGTAAQERD